MENCNRIQQRKTEQVEHNKNTTNGVGIDMLVTMLKQNFLHIQEIAITTYAK